jgi:hypothetical protein
VVQALWARITAEKNAYNAALAEYKVNHGQFSVKRAALIDMLNPQKLDQMLANSAKAIEDSWTTVGLQRGMNSLVKEMSGDFEKVFAASEDIKKLMQGVYNTFIEKFGFQKMKIPSLDLDPHRTKLQLLVHQTDAFVRDPVNVVVKEKHFVVKNFYNTLVKACRANFTDAKNQADRWMQAVVLPLEVQIKDHKAQLQSRLDNLAKINEKTTSINEQMAILKAAEADLRKQREMIEGLIARVTAHAAASSLDTDQAAAPAAGPARAAPVDMMATTKLSTFEGAPRVTPAQAGPQSPKKPAEPEKPLVSDDLMAGLASIGAPKPTAPAFDPSATQKLPPGADQTQKLPTSADRTQKLTPEQMEQTQRIKALGPDDTHPGPAAPSAPAAGPETTQRIDDSIWRLEEAKRILRNIPQKS